ncbi:hypothetical protein XENOCAPTIV_013598, partial [Xenoophorus captivus]
SPAALVNHIPLLHYIKSVKISPIRDAGGVLHVVRHYLAAGQLQVDQVRRAQPLLQTPVLRDLIRSVSARPAIGGMRFLDVHHHGVRNVRVLLRDLLESLQTRHERRSGAAPEVEDKRSVAVCAVQDPGVTLVLQPNNFGVGRSASEMRSFQKVQFLAVPDGLQGFKAEQAVGVRYAERRINGIALLLFHP